MSPRRLLRACTFPGCPELVTAGRCLRHGQPGAPASWSTASRAAPLRLRGRKWMRLRLAVLSDEPTCYLCGTYAHPDDIVDHVVPLAAGGTDDRENLHRCCRTCHTAKIGREANSRRAGGLA